MRRARCNRPELADSATRAVDFVRADLWRDGRLLAAYKDGRSRFPAYLDDYAFLLDGLLELLQTRWRSDDLLFAVDLADALLAHFEDSAARRLLLHGGRSRSPHASLEIISRMKPCRPATASRRRR